jgi:hypothetical protein
MSSFNLNPLNIQQEPSKMQAEAATQKFAQKVINFCERFNSTPGVKQLQAGEIIAKLQEADVVNDEIFKALQAEDLIRIVGVSGPVARAMLQAFSDEERDASLRTRATAIRAQTMTLKQLLASYDPNDPLAPVTSELQRRLNSRGQHPKNPKVIVFCADGAVDIKQSSLLIKDYIAGDGQVEYIRTTSGQHKTYRVGEVPEQIVGVHPITGAELKSSGVGKDDGLDWSMCSLECKQLLRIAVSIKELDPNSITRRDLIDYHHAAQNSESGLAYLQNLFPKAAIEFENLKAVDDLPKLKRLRGARHEVDSTDPVELARRR